MSNALTKSTDLASCGSPCQSFGNLLWAVARDESKLAVEVPYKYLVVPPRHPIHHHIPIPSLRLPSRLRQHNHTMSFNQFNNIRRHEILERMGIEQLPALMPGQEHPDVEPEERRPEVPLVMLPVSNNSYFPIFCRCAF